MCMYCMCMYVYMYLLYPRLPLELYIMNLHNYLMVLAGTTSYCALLLICT